MSGEVDPQLDEERWDEAERFWRRVVDALASQAGQPDEWASAWPRFFGNGVTPLPREDRPVCDGRNWALDRAFAIWEFKLVEGEAGIAAEVEDYATVFEDGGQWLEEGSPHDRVARTYLEIRLERSEQTVELARMLLSRWMRPATTVPEMESLIEDTPGVVPW